MAESRPLPIALVEISSPTHYSLWNALSIETLAGHLRGVFQEQVAVTLRRIQQYPDIESLLTEIRNCPPRILGISPELGSLEWTTQFCDRLRQLRSRDFPMPKLVFGNKLPTFFPDDFLEKYPEAIIVIGEGEEALQGIVEHFLSNKSLVAVPNLVYAGKDGTVIRTIQRNPDLSKLIYPPSTDTVPELARIGANALLQASRGCSWSRCTYCTIRSFRKNRHWEGFPVQRVLANVKDLVSCGVTELEFADDEFLGGRNDSRIARAHQIADGLAKLAQDTNARITFRIFLIPHTIYREGQHDRNEAIKELLIRLKQVGLAKIYIGAEAGSSSQLERYGRGYTKTQLQEVFSIMAEINVPVDVGFVMFDPHLSLHELLENIRFFRDCNLIKSNQWPFRPLVVNIGSQMLKDLTNSPLLGNINMNYMCYDYQFLDSRIESIFRTVDSLSLETRHLFYSLKVVSKRQFDCQKKDQETLRAQTYVEKNGLIYLDLMEALARFYQGTILTDEQVILSDARKRIDNLVGVVAEDIKHGLISDPRGVISGYIEQYTNFLSTQKGRANA